MRLCPEDIRCKRGYRLRQQQKRKTNVTTRCILTNRHLLYKKKSLHLPPPLGGPVKAQLWDTAGQERFSKVLLPTYFRKARGCVLVYDLGDLRTLRSLEGKWLKECEGIKGIVVGNKCDLGEYDEQVREREREREREIHRSNKRLFIVQNILT